MNITGGKYNSRKIKAPSTDKVRPTLSKIRAGIFNSLSSVLNFEDASFLDCFGGSGIMSLEAISRGFKRVVTTEKDIKIANIIKENFYSLKETPNIIVKDVTVLLDNIKEKFDVIYIDPPYSRTELYKLTIEKICKNSILSKNGFIIIESPKDVEMPFLTQYFEIQKEKIYGDKKILFLKNIVE